MLETIAAKIGFVLLAAFYAYSFYTNLYTTEKMSLSHFPGFLVGGLSFPVKKRRSYKDIILEVGIQGAMLWAIWTMNVHLVIFLSLFIILFDLLHALNSMDELPGVLDIIYVIIIKSVAVFGISFFIFGIFFFLNGGSVRFSF